MFITDTYQKVTDETHNGKPILLWIDYEPKAGFGTHVRIHGAHNPLPINDFITRDTQHISHWLKADGWQRIGIHYTREIKKHTTLK